MESLTAGRAAVVDVRMPPSDDDHRRVLAVLAWLRDSPAAGGAPSDRSQNGTLAAARTPFWS